MSQDQNNESSTEEEDIPLPGEQDGPGLFGGSPSEKKNEATPVAPKTPTKEALEQPKRDKSSEDPIPYQVLARKYRPRRFKDLIGQDSMVQTLRNSFALGRVAHAFMLTGIRGVGKTTTARIIARALNCTGRKDPHDVEPCGHCKNCIAILKGRHPDVIEMDAASKTGVDDVREIIESAQFRPLLGRKKVFIIDEVHMLSRNAFNSLLKTLEEPPEHVVFIFATTELRKVPITVISRCQRFDLLRIPQEKLVQFFGEISKKEHVSISHDGLALIAQAAEGSVRDGLSLLDQAIIQSDGTLQKNDEISAEAIRKMLGVADGRVVADLLLNALEGKPQEALSLMDKAWQQGVDCALILKDLLGLLHDISRYKAISTVEGLDLLCAVDPKIIEDIGRKFDVPVIMRAWQLLLKGLSEIETAPDRRAAADMVMIRLCYVANMPTPSQAIAQMMGQKQPIKEQSKPQIKKNKPDPAPASLPVKEAPEEKTFQEQKKNKTGSLA